MKKIKILLFSVCFISIYSAGFAQKRMEFSDLYLTNSLNGTFTGPLSQQEVNTMESGLYPLNLVKPNTNLYNNRKSGGRFTGNIGIMAGWDINGTRIKQQKLRVGFTAGFYKINWENRQEEKNTYRIDTLVSQQSGEQFLIDSTRMKTLYYEHLAQMFNLNADYLLYLNPENKISFYTGFGARLGVSLSNTVTANYEEYSYIENNGNREDFYNEYDHNNKDDDFLFQSRSKSLSPALNIGANALVGLNWRLSNRCRFFKHINLFSELHLGLAITTIQEINANIGTELGIQSGVRYSFNNPKKSTSSSMRY